MTSRWTGGSVANVKTVAMPMVARNGIFTIWMRNIFVRIVRRLRNIRKNYDLNELHNIILQKFNAMRNIS